MASTYSTSLRLELMATGDQSGTWGDTTNTNLGTLLEQAITGVLSVSQGDAELTLTSTDGASDQARNAVVNLTGAMTSAQNVIVPDANKLYLIKNSTSGGFSIVAKTAAGTGISIPPGASMNVYSDGTNVVMGQNYWSGQIGGAVYLDAGATVGPVYDLFRDSTSPAASDILGQVLFNGRDSAGNKQEYGSIESVIVSPTSTTEASTLDFYSFLGGLRVRGLSIVGPVANSPSFAAGYTTTATAAGTTTLTVSSTQQQYFTGATTQTVVLPVTSTLVLGQTYQIFNSSTGAVTVQSSGANSIVVIPPNSSAILTCILTSGTTAASWSSAASAGIYVEGTWTPIDSSGASLSLTASGVYTKIGNMCFASSSITFPATANGSFNSIGGLPFTVANAEAARTGTISFSTTALAARVIVAANATTLTVVKTDGTQLTNAELSSVTIYISATYRAA